MTSPLVAVMILYSLGMAAGQVLFKLAAMRSSDMAVPDGFWKFANGYLIVGLFLYAFLTLLWVWILRSVPLSKAYPFVALAFLFTPLLARFILGELLPASYFIGLALIAAGIIVVVRG